MWGPFGSAGENKGFSANDVEGTIRSRFGGDRNKFEAYIKQVVELTFPALFDCDPQRSQVTLDCTDPGKPKLEISWFRHWNWADGTPVTKAQGMGNVKYRAQEKSPGCEIEFKAPNVHGPVFQNVTFRAGNLGALLAAYNNFMKEGKAFKPSSLPLELLQIDLADKTIAEPHHGLAARKVALNAAKINARVEDLPFPDVKDAIRSRFDGDFNQFEAHMKAATKETFSKLFKCDPRSTVAFDCIKSGKVRLEIGWVDHWNWNDGTPVNSVLGINSAVIAARDKSPGCDIKLDASEVVQLAAIDKKPVLNNVIFEADSLDALLKAYNNFMQEGKALKKSSIPLETLQMTLPQKGRSVGAK